MQHTLKTFDQAIAIGNLDSYTHWVNQIPMLTADEEQQLARQWREEENYDAAKRLVMSHLRFVVRVARGYAGYGLALADLIQEGNIGLMKAVKRFDPTVGVRLVSFAVHWVKAEIHEFVIKNWRIVKVATTKAQRKLFFNLRSAKKRLGWFSSEEVNAVANDLGVSTKDVLEMEARLNARDPGFDLQDADDDSSGGSSRMVSPCQYLADVASDPAILVENDVSNHSGREQLYQALSQLDARSQDILSSRWLADKKATLHDLAAKYGISAERVRQLEKQAMNKLKDQIDLA